MAIRRLVFETTIVRGEQRSSSLVSYRLERGGARLVVDERFREPEISYDNSVGIQAAAISAIRITATIMR